VRSEKGRVLFGGRELPGNNAYLEGRHGLPGSLRYLQTCPNSSLLSINIFKFPKFFPYLPFFFLTFSGIYLDKILWLWLFYI
jgi:hypothetical protein